MKSSKTNMNIKLAEVFSNANLIVHSQVPSRILERKTGLNHTTVLRIRRGVRNLSGTTLRTCLRLSAYPSEKIDFNTDELWSIFQQAIDYIPVVHLSKRLHIPRITLERLRGHQAKLLNTNITVTMKLVDFYNKYVKNHETVLG